MMRQLVAGLLVLCLLGVVVESRYLPTRSQDDRLVRLRQLLKDLLENDIEDSRPDVGYDPRLYKREAYEQRPSVAYIH